MDLINTKELCKEVDATYRQIDYWTRNGIIPCETPLDSGSGTYRFYDKTIIPRVKMLVHISKVFEHRLDGFLLKRIYDAYPAGLLEMSDDVLLVWTKPKEFE